jgi:hypothetical protein
MSTLNGPYLECILIINMSAIHSIITFWFFTYNNTLLSLISFKSNVIPPFQIEHPNSLPQCMYIWEFHLKFQGWNPKVNCMELRPSNIGYFSTSSSLATGETSMSLLPISELASSSSTSSNVLFKFQSLTGLPA